MNDKRSKAWQWLRRGAAGILSLMLVFSLIQPGLASADETYICGKEEHAHGDSCYKTETVTNTTKVLSCNPLATAYAEAEGETADFVVHTHAGNCYEDETLVCDLDEVEVHTHEDACYETAEEPSCGKAVEEAHAHTDACQKKLVCTDTTEGHVHADACYEAVTCEKPVTEGHAHTDACYSKELTCGKNEIVLHTHAEGCYITAQGENGEEIAQLDCETTEVKAHEHREECYTDEEKTEDIKTLTCTLEEHAHTDECKVQVKTVLTCGKEEHAHTEQCYAAQEDPAAEKTLTCGKEEHTHTDACKATVEKCQHCGVELLEGAVHAEDCLSLCICGEGFETHGAECPLFKTAEFVPPVNFTRVAGLMKREQPKFMTWGRRTATVNNEYILTGKKVEYNEATDNYTLTLESCVTGASQTTETDVPPSDIVLVLDVTGSMTWCINCGGANYNSASTHDCTCGASFKSREEAMEEAVAAFLTNVAASGQNHRVGVAVFSYNGNSGILYAMSNGGLTWDNIEDGVYNYDKALFSLTADNATKIITKVNDRTINGGTHHSIGTNLAKNIFANNSNVTEEDGQTITRNRVVVYFSDGSPSDSAGKNTTYTSGAVSDAYTIKHDYGATFYTVGVFSGATADYPLQLVSWDDFEFNDNDPPTGNTLMHLMSSNYPNCVTVTNRGSLNPEITVDATGRITNEGYYLAASSSDALTDIFTQIADKVTTGGSAIKLGTETVVRDVVTQSFEIVETENVPQVCAYTMTCNGINNSYNANTDAEIEQYTFVKTDSDVEISADNISVNGNIVDVTGFNFSENWVGAHTTNSADGSSTTYRGKKLVIEITIDTLPDFLGGNGVVTNTSDSAIYSGGEVMEHFGIPELNIPVKEIEPVFRDGKIYLGEQAVVPHIANVGHFWADEDGDGDLDDTTTDGINNEYANIIYTITDTVANKSATYTIPAKTHHDNSDWEGELDTLPLLRNDNTYRVTVRVEPSVPYEDATEDDAGQDPVRHEETNSNQEILVYKPHITFKDSIIEYGETADYEGDNYDSVAWYHGEATDENKATVDMGPAPVLTFTYSPTEGAFQKETPVQVTGVKPSNSPARSGNNYTHSVPAEPEQNLIGEQEPEGIVFFYRNLNGDDACEFGPCTSKEQTTVSTEGSTWTNFVVHLNGYDVTIQKQLKDGYTDIHGTYKVDVVIKSDKLEVGMVINYKHVNENGEYTDGSYTVQEDRQAILSGITIKTDKSATIYRVPYDATYTITETNGYGYNAEYTYSLMKRNEGAINTNDEVSTGTVTNAPLTTEKTPVVIDVTKNILNPNKKDHTFDFKLVQVDEDGKILYGEDEKPVYEEEISIKLKGGDESESGKFTALYYETKDLAGGTVENNAMKKKFYYMVTETAQDDGMIVDADETKYIVEVTLTGKQNVLEAAITDILKDDESITKDGKITFNNILLGSLTVSKRIVGGDAKSFKFRLTVDKKISDDFYAEVNGKETTFTIKDGIADFWLGHKDEITIYGLPHGEAVEIYEYAGDYHPYYKVDSSRTYAGRTVKTEFDSSGTTVKYTNYADGDMLPQTGQLKWPILALAVLGAGFLGFGVLTKKRKRNGK